MDAGCFLFLTGHQSFGCGGAGWIDDRQSVEARTTPAFDAQSGATLHPGAGNR